MANTCISCGTWTQEGLPCLSCGHVTAAAPPPSPPGGPASAASSAPNAADPSWADVSVPQPPSPNKGSEGLSEGKILAIAGGVLAVVFVAIGAFVLNSGDSTEVASIPDADRPAATSAAPTTSTAPTSEAPVALAMVDGSATAVDASYCDNPGYFADAPAPVEGELNGFVSFGRVSDADDVAQGEWATWPELAFEARYADYLAEYGIDPVAPVNVAYVLCASFSDVNLEPDFDCSSGLNGKFVDIELYSLSTGEVLVDDRRVKCFEVDEALGEHVLPFGHSRESLKEHIGSGSADSDAYCSNPVALANSGQFATEVGLTATGRIHFLDGNDEPAYPGLTTHVACAIENVGSESTLCDGYQETFAGQVIPGAPTFDLTVQHTSYQVRVIELATGTVVDENSFEGDRSCPDDLTVNEIEDQAREAPFPRDPIREWIAVTAATAYAAG